MLSSSLKERMAQLKSLQEEEKKVIASSEKTPDPVGETPDPVGETPPPSEPEVSGKNYSIWMGNLPVGSHDRFIESVRTNAFMFRYDPSSPFNLCLLDSKSSKSFNFFSRYRGENGRTRSSCGKCTGTRRGRSGT